MKRFWLGIAILGITTIAPAFVMAGDQEIAQQVAANLKNSGKLKGYNVSVVVNQGVVELNGSVTNQRQMDDALAIAEVTPGIERVVNNLDVIPSQGAAKPSSVMRQPGNLFSNSDVQQASSVSAPSNAKPAFVPPASQQVQVVRSPNARLAQSAPLPLGATSAPNYGTPRPLQMAHRQTPAPGAAGPAVSGSPIPAHVPTPYGSPAPAAYDSPNMPNYAWPSYAAYPNYAALTYPKQYSATAWPYIGPFYPYPQVPLGWRKVTLEWDDGWWMLDFKD